MKIYNKKLLGIFAASAVIAITASVGSFAGGCAGTPKTAKDLSDKLAAEQTGGTPDNGVKPPIVVQTRAGIKAILAAGCGNSLGPDYASKGYTTDGSIIGSENTPPSPGDNSNSSGSDVYVSSKDAKGGGSSMLPMMKGLENNVKVGLGGTTPPKKDSTNTAANNGGTGAAAASPNAGSVCGKVAAEYGAYLAGLTGAEAPTYKPGCAGTNADNTARSTPDGNGAVCTGNQFGQFGLVQAAYNNAGQTLDVSSLSKATPSSIPAGVVASKNVSTGAANEPNGCRLSSYAKCGQVGDVIMVQSKVGAKASDPYDAYLIYAGDNSFYQVQHTGGKAVVKATLPSQYYNSSYAAVREPCAGAQQASN